MSKSRIAEERAVVALMISIYCRAHHPGAIRVTHSGLCDDCRELLTYANERLSRCPFGEAKGVCNRCEIHCYKPQMRTRIAEVMRYSGRRMLFHSPLAAVKHLWRVKFSRR